MKPEAQLIADRRAAMHCSALLRPRTETINLLPLLDRLAGAIALRLAATLAPLCGEGVEISASPAEELDMPMLAASIGQLAGNSLVAAIPANGNFLVSVDAAAILRLVDRSFGGTGELPDEFPERFSLSDRLVATRIEAAILKAAAQALSMADERLLKPLHSDGSIALLAPFAEDCRLASFTLEVMRGDDPSWSVTLAFPLDVLAALVANGGIATSLTDEPRPKPGPGEAPFCEIPLPVRAVLVDMKLPLATVSALRPGQVLPIAVARNVPLMAGAIAIARGTVGELDDRIALQINHLP